MSIKGKELMEYKPSVRYMDGSVMDLDFIEEQLWELAEKYELPITIERDEVSYGLLSPNEPCLIAYHPEHKNNYFNFCIQRKEQGKAAIVTTHMFGKSTQMKREAVATAKTGAGLAVLFGGTVGAGYALGRGLVKGFNALGRSKAKLEEEKYWYTIMEGLFAEVIY